MLVKVPIRNVDTPLLPQPLPPTTTQTHTSINAPLKLKCLKHSAISDIGEGERVMTGKLLAFPKRSVSKFAHLPRLF